MNPTNTDLFANLLLTGAAHAAYRNGREIDAAKFYAESAERRLESRNVAADYERAYGRVAPRVKGLRLQINSQHTGTTAESYFGEVAFRSTLQ